MIEKGIEIVDLTQPIETGMQVYPGAENVKIENCVDYKNDQWHVDMLHISTHAGTHIDAPYHHIEKGKKIDEFPLEKFTGVGIVCDLTGKEPMQQLEPQDFSAYDDLLDDVEIVVVKTGWEKYYGTKEYENHPYLSEAAARYLTKKGISIAAVDAFSLDSTSLDTDHAHSVLLKNETLLVENLRNLDSLAAGRKYVFSFMPLAVKGSDGSPIRAVCYAKK